MGGRKRQYGWSMNENLRGGGGGQGSFTGKDWNDIGHQLRRDSSKKGKTRTQRPNPKENFTK